MSIPSQSICNERFYAGGRAGAAELKLTYAVEQNLELAVLIGESGLGKTTLLRRLANRLVGQGHTLVDVYFPQLEADEMLAFIASELDDLPTPSLRRDDLLRRIAGQARRLAEQNRALTILVDDAHHFCSAGPLEALHLLLNLRERENVRMSVVLAGRRTLLATLAQMPSLAQRIGITATLLPLNAAETIDYARHLLPSSSPHEILIDDDALHAVYEMTGGVPRAINRLCEMAAVITAAHGGGSLTLADLRNVSEELPRFTCEAA